MKVRTVLPSLGVSEITAGPVSKVVGCDAVFMSVMTLISKCQLYSQIGKKKKKKSFFLFLFFSSGPSHLPYKMASVIL